MNVLIALLVTVTMASVYFCDVRYTRALLANRIYQSGLWGVTGWGAATVGFVIAVKLSMYYLPFEACGVFIGIVTSGKVKNRRNNEASNGVSSV